MLSTWFRDAQPSLQPTRTNFQKSCERFPLSSEERAVVLRPREREKVAAGRMRAVGIKTNPVVRRSFPLTSFSFRGTTPVVRPPLKAIPPSSGLIAPRALRWNWPQLPPVRFPLPRFPLSALPPLHPRKVFRALPGYSEMFNARFPLSRFPAFRFALLPLCPPQLRHLRVPRAHNCAILSHLAQFYNPSIHP